MSNDDFYGAYKLINDKIGNFALIDTTQFIYLKRIYGHYIWVPLAIKDLPKIPIKLVDVEVNSTSRNDLTRVSMRPIWTFYTNNKMIVTPRIERFIFTESLSDDIQHSVVRNSKINEHFITTDNYQNRLDSGIYVEKENAVEWNKDFDGISFGFDDEEKLNDYVNSHKSGLSEFDRIYDKSLEVAEECKRYQKRYIR